MQSKMFLQYKNWMINQTADKELVVIPHNISNVHNINTED